MSHDHQAEVLVEEDRRTGEILLRSPAVGMFAGVPRVGEILVSGSRVGRITALGRTTRLVLPKEVSGRVSERMLRNRRDPVDYGYILLRLTPVVASEAEVATDGNRDSAADDLPEGSFAVVSPTHGMFYRRPRPDAPAYVECGQVVEQGNTLALVEVMKCFSAITYGGENLPPRAEVVEIRAEDSAEVQAEQILFVVQPV